MNPAVKKVLVVLLLIVQATVAQAAAIPVLLRISVTDQSDTTGCNFAEQFLQLVYDEVTSGRAKMWDSPDKEVQITGLTLKELEKVTSTSFIKQPHFFVYEMWQNTKTDLISQTLGFTFNNKNPVGEDVSYGYVDYNDIKEVCQRSRLPVNANGNYSSTYSTFILYKLYNYNIIQFNGKLVPGAAESQKIKSTFIAQQSFNRTISGPVYPDKLVSSIVEPNFNLNDDKTLSSNLMIATIGDFLTENREVFYNLGGDRILSHIHSSEVKVTRLEISERWSMHDAKLKTELRSMIIYVNDSALNFMTGKEVAKLGIWVGMNSLYDFIAEKKFNYIITQINAQKISRREAYLYQKGLFSSEWNLLTEFVKNF